MRNSLLGIRTILLSIGLPCMLTMAVCLSGCRNRDYTPVHGLVHVVLQLDWYPQPEQGGFFCALVNGYYKEVGLDVSINSLPQYGSVPQIVVMRNADFGLGSSDSILVWNSNDLPFVAVGATMQHDPQAVMVHAESTVKSFADLNERTIAAQPGAIWFKYMVKRYNLDQAREVPSTHSIANFLADPNYVQQVFATSEPFFVKQAGSDERTLLISDTGYDPYRVFFTTHRFAEEHPDLVAKFVRASIRGWQEYLRNPEPTNVLIRKLNPALNAKQIAFTIASLKAGNFITGSDTNDAGIGRMSDARWKQMNEQLESLGILHRPVDYKAAYTLQFLPQ